jgi:hypothetical protein
LIYGELEELKLKSELLPSIGMPVMQKEFLIKLFKKKNKSFLGIL